MSFSQSFFEQVVILALTAVVTGFLVPYILRRIDERRLREQQIVEAQTRLLDSLTKQLWEFQLLALSVSYYKLQGREEDFKGALERYDSRSWEFFGSLRTEISVAGRLTTERTYKKLLQFYHDWLIPMDRALMSLVKQDASTAEWQEFHNSLQKSGPKTDEIISLLAGEFGLSKHKTRPITGDGPSHPGGSEWQAAPGG
jgi:hypothetical protein